MLNALFQRQDVQSLFLMGIRGTSLVSKFILTLFVARFMGFEALGIYGLIMAASVALPVFLGFGLMYSLSRKAVTLPLQEITEILHYYGRFIVCIYGALFLITMPIALYFDKEILILLTLLIIFLEHFNQDLYNLFLNLSRPLIANTLFFVRSGVWMLLFMALSFVFPAFRTIEILLFSWLCGGVFAFLGLWGVMHRWPWALKAPLRSLRHWFYEEYQQAKMLYGASVAKTISTYADRYIITFLLGLELTGIYVFFWSVGSAMSNLIYTGIVQLSRPKLVRAHKDKDPSFGRLYRHCLVQTVLISIAMSVFCALFIYFILPYLDKPQAIEWFPLLLLILTAFILFVGSYVQELVFYSRHEDKLTFKISIFVFVCSLIVNVASIYFFGLWGAGIAFILTSLLRYIVQHQYIKDIEIHDR